LSRDTQVELLSLATQSSSDRTQPAGGTSSHVVDEEQWILRAMVKFNILNIYLL
jgi:hypothetical protein